MLLLLLKNLAHGGSDITVVSYATPDCRIHIIGEDDRTHIINKNDRSHIIEKDNRTHVIEC